MEHGKKCNILYRDPASTANDNIVDPYLNLMNKFKVEEEGDYIDDYLDLYNSHINSLTKQLDDKEVVNALSHQSVSPWIKMTFTTQTTNRATIDRNWRIIVDNFTGVITFRSDRLTLKRHFNTDNQRTLFHKTTNEDLI